MNHLAQLFLRDALFALAFLLDESPLLDHIARAEKQNAFTGQAVTSSPPRLLIIALDVLRQIMMNHKPHVRFVDPHPERDRRRDHPRVVAQKLFLVSCSLLPFESRVIRLRFDSIVIQFRC